MGVQNYADFSLSDSAQQSLYCYHSILKFSPKNQLCFSCDKATTNNNKGYKI